MSKNPFAIYQQAAQIKDSKLNQKYRSRLIDSFSITSSIKDKFKSLGINLKKINFLGLILGTAFLLLCGRLLYLQVVSGADYRQIAEENRLRLQVIKASRGIVYDRNLIPLVKNIPNFTLNLSPLDFPTDSQEKANILNAISQITNVSVSQLEEKIAAAPSAYQTYTLLEQIPYEQALILIGRSDHWPGIQMKTSAIREYLHEPGFSHFMGYIGKISATEYQEQSADYQLTDYLGKAGLEQYYENILRGQDGRKQIEVNSEGKEKEVVAEEKAIPGANLILSLDYDLQQKASAILQNYINLRQAPGGTVIIMDPRQGEILSLVSWPAYDNNKFITGLSTEEYQAYLDDETKPLFNRAIGGTYPPGSTFKTIVAAAALQEGVINAQTTVNSVGGIQVNKWFFPDWKAGGHGLTDIRKALADSVNTFFYLAGGGTYNEETREIEGGLGVNKINYYAELFGLNQTTGIDLPGEKTGFLPTKEWKESTKGEMWYIGDTYHLAIGQGDVLITPLQLANVTAALANGGTLYQPHLLQSLTDENNQIVSQPEARIIRQNFINSQNIQLVREGMRQAVTAGSASSLQVLPVSSAGKTGTAQIPNSDKTHSWFTCFAPYEQPEIVVTVLVEEGGDGTEAAVPIAREILQYYYSR